MAAPPASHLARNRLPTPAAVSRSTNPRRPAAPLPLSRQQRTIPFSFQFSGQLRRVHSPVRPFRAEVQPLPPPLPPLALGHEALLARSRAAASAIHQFRLCIRKRLHAPNGCADERAIPPASPKAVPSGYRASDTRQFLSTNPVSCYSGPQMVAETFGPGDSLTCLTLWLCLEQV